MIWYENIKGSVRKNESLKAHTTFKIGGKVDYFIEPQDPAALGETLVLLKKRKLPVRILGAGSNILASDGRLKGAVISLSAPAFRTLAARRGRIEMGAGVPLATLLSFALAQGRKGGEFLAGIPGTVGGALWMNAGIAFTRPDGKRGSLSIADIVDTVTVMDYRGKKRVLPRARIPFRYRGCGLGKAVILSATLALEKGDRRQIRRDIRRRLAERAAGQERTTACAGCVFKNPGHESAGKLIDGCGLKGARVNDARISRRHANFIVNSGCARAKDVLQLMSLIRKRVKAKYQYVLEPEIVLWK